MLFKMMTNTSTMINLFIFLFLSAVIFYFWFKLITLENMVFILTEKLKKNTPSVQQPIRNMPLKQEDQNSFNLEDMIMKEVFCCPSNESCKINLQPNVEFIDEEIKDEPEKPKVEIFDLKKEEVEVEVDTKSEISNINALPSKKSLLKLNLDGLKDKCSSLNLSTEGTKAQLIDRILAA